MTTREILRAYRVPLDPTDTQTAALAPHAGASRAAFNWAHRSSAGDTLATITNEQAIRNSRAADMFGGRSKFELMCTARRQVSTPVVGFRQPKG